jgi:hypothetical protein
VTRIAEVLLALRQAGNVAYSGHVVVVNCARCITSQEEKEQELQKQLAKQHIVDLSALAKEMEGALEDWENEVKESRRQFYALNYYTTRQLLKIRKELSLFRQNPHRQISPEVLVLLQSISPAVTSEDVQSTLMESEIPPGATESDLKSLPPPPPSSSSSGIEKLQATEQTLTDAQKAILTNLTEYQDYSRSLVLKAFEKCGEKANDYDIQHWCGKYEIEYRDESSSESDCSDEEEANSNAPPQQQQSPKGTPKVEILHMYTGDTL